MNVNVLIGDKEMFLCVYTEGYTGSPYQVSVLSHSQAITASLRVLLTATIALLRCPSEPRWLTSAVALPQTSQPPKMIRTPAATPWYERHTCHERLVMEKKVLFSRQVCQKRHGGRRWNTSVWPQHHQHHLTEGQRAAAGKSGGGGLRMGRRFRTFAPEFTHSLQQHWWWFVTNRLQIFVLHLHPLSSSQSHKGQMHFPIMTNNLSNSIKYASVNVLLNSKRVC